MAKKVQKSASEQLIEEIQTLGQTQGLNNVFTTFLEMLAVSLNAQVDPRYAEEREKRYQQMVSGMSQEMLSTYARMFALMYMAVKEHSEEPSDILGSIYHRLGLNNEWNGQFFTDDHICRMMAMFVDPVDELPDEKPFTVNDPACGSGAMFLASAWAMKRKGIDYQKKCLFIGRDIDIRCVWMAYIQMFLNQIPGIVVHGNTITMEEWSEWVTPYALLSLSQDKNPSAAQQKEEIPA